MDYRELAETVGPRTGATQEWVFRVLREHFTKTFHTSNLVFSIWL